MESGPETEHLQKLPTGGWRTPHLGASLSEVFRTVSVPASGPVWRRLLAFVGPGYLIAVGYMDPGNWATDIAGGARFAYALLSVVLMSNFIAIFLQGLSSKLGIVSGRDLAQACRDAYPKPFVVFLWISAEIAIVACDVAEVIGAAIALNLLFHLPLVWGVIVTAADVLVLLALQHRGFRLIEIFVIGLILTVTIIFLLELLYAAPDWTALGRGFVPTSQILSDPAMLYLSLGILGATVMPHNLYLHSAIVQTRRYGHSIEKLKEAVKLAWADSTIALSLALFVNAAILAVASATFYSHGHHGVEDIRDAYKLLSPLLGVSVATPLFAIALLASGQNSTITGTMAGQVILEGFTNFAIEPWLRRMISRAIAIVPTVAVVMIAGSDGLKNLLLFSQVVLSAQLVFAVFPLVQFTSDREKMGPFVNGVVTRWLGWFLTLLIFGLNAYLIYGALTAR